MAFSPAPKTLIGASLLLLVLATLFGVLNIAKVKTLRSNVTEIATARDNAERRRATQEKEIKGREAAVAAEKAKIAEAQRNVGGAEAELIKMQKEKADLQAELQANQSEIILLQKQLEEMLNLGGRQGVEPLSEMLVLRDGAFIGKIRISSVEPATAIGDIITSSLARGVQVQPGDVVIYAGANS
jgi:septal ring factor EnvC (AmiA/AmiB activator)